MLGGMELAPAPGGSYRPPARAGVAALAAGSGLVAVGTQEGTTLLFVESNLSEPFLEVCGRRGDVTALRFSRDGRVLFVGAGDGALVRLELGEHQSARQEVSLEAGDLVACIRRQEEADLFAVAAGRCERARRRAVGGSADGPLHVRCMQRGGGGAHHALPARTSPPPTP